MLSFILMSALSDTVRLNYGEYPPIKKSIAQNVWNGNYKFVTFTYNIHKNTNMQKKVDYLIISYTIWP